MLNGKHDAVEQNYETTDLDANLADFGNSASNKAIPMAHEASPSYQTRSDPERALNRHGLVLI